MSGPPLLAIGASAGGIEALRQLLPTLPPDFGAAIALVLHRSPVEVDDRLPRVLALGSPLPVRHAIDGERLEPSRVYVAPAAVHMTVRDGRIALTAGPRENNSRPSIDVLFRGAAFWYGPRAAGLIMSGLLDDGTAGLAAIAAAGGCTFAQDPEEAQFSDMPRNAIANVEIDAVAAAHALAPVLLHFVEVANQVSAGPSPVHEEVQPSTFSCPACGGVLNELDVDGLTRYRCRTGHAYSPRSLFERQEDALESALWEALRALEERIDLSQRLAVRAHARGYTATAERFEAQARAAGVRAETVRVALGTAQDAQNAAIAERTEPDAPALSRRP